MAAETSDSPVKKIIFLAGKASHGYGAHEHRAGSLLLAGELNEHAADIVAAEVHLEKDWPKNESVIEEADAIVFYCDGGPKHMAQEHLAALDMKVKEGCGVACLHYATIGTEGEVSNKLIEWVGGNYEPNWSVNPKWEADFTTLPKHPVTNGVKPFKILDEWYFHLRFVDEMQGLTPILSAHPPPETMSRKDGPNSGNPAVRKALEAGEIQHLAWTYERQGGGRGFGFTGGHFHANWANDDFRKLVLNAIVWVARAEVPEGGIQSDPPTEADLEKNQDYPEP